MLVKVAAAHDLHQWRVAEVTVMAKQEESTAQWAQCAMRDNRIRFVSKLCQRTKYRKPKAKCCSAID